MLGSFSKLLRKTLQSGDLRRFDRVRMVAVDTELTGLDTRRDSIVSIGAVAITGGAIDISDRFYSLVKPESELARESILVHGIMPAELESVPDSKSVMNRFITFFDDAVPLGFFADIDAGFINRAVKKSLGKSFTQNWIDVRFIYEKYRERYTGKPLPSSKDGLFAIAAALGIEAQGAHNAMADAFVTAQIFQRLIPFLSVSGALTVNDIMKLQSYAILTASHEPTGAGL